MLTRSRRIALGLLVAALAGGMLSSAATHAQGAARAPMTMGRRIPNPVWRPWGAVQPVETVAAPETITPAPTDTATPPVTLTSTDTPTATPALAPTQTPTPTATLSPTPTPVPVPPTDTATPLPPPTATPAPPPTSPPQPLPLFPSTPTRPAVPPPVPARPTATPTPQAHRQRRPAKKHRRQAQHKARHPSTHHRVVLNHLRLWARPPIVGVHGIVTVGVQANTGGVHLYMVVRYGVGREETRHGTAPHRGAALLRLHVPTVAPCTGRLVARVYVTVASGPRAMTGAVTFLVQCPGTKAPITPSKPRVRLR